MQKGIKPDEIERGTGIVVIADQPTASESGKEIVMSEMGTLIAVLATANRPTV